METGVFPDSLKIAKETPVFKTGDLKEISNYRPISVLPCFSKILERIMHNHLYSYLVNEKNIIFKAVRLPKKSFHRACYCSISWQNSWIIWKRQLHIWVFYWFIQGLGTIDYAISFKKLENYGIKGTNLDWFRSYFTNKKQYSQITNDSKSCLWIAGSFLGPLLFLVYVNDLQSSSEILNPIMSADDTSFFYKNKNIIQLFYHSKWRTSEYKWLVYGK